MPLLVLVARRRPPDAPTCRRGTAGPAPPDAHPAGPPAAAWAVCGQSLAPGPACQTAGMAPRFLTVADVAETLNITGTQVYALLRSGELPAIQLGGKNV